MDQKVACEPSGPGILVVQARGSATDLLDGLRRQGARVLGYLPLDSYVVLSPEGSCKLQKSLQAVWVGAFRREWKVNPAVFENGRVASSLYVTAFRGLGLDGLADDLAGIARVVSLGFDSSKTGYAVVHAEPGKSAEALAAVTSADEVAWVDPLRPVAPDNDDSVWVIQSGNETTPLFDNGIIGLGQVIALADSGLDTDACQFRYSDNSSSQTFFNQTQPPDFLVTDPENKVISYYLLDGATPYDDRSKLGHGTHVAGCAAGDSYMHLAGDSGPGRDPGDGMAPAAKIVFQDIGHRDGNQTGLPDSLVDLYVQAYKSGARIHVNAYGLTEPETRYTGRAWQADQASWMLQDLLVVFSSGNLGPGSSTLDGLGSTAKNVLTVGASLPGRDNLGRGVCAFSSQGPTSDGRIKPDIVAPGVVKSALETDWIERGGRDVYGKPRADSTTDPGNDNCAVDESYRVGTSYSAPIAAGGAALVRQYFEDGFHPGGFKGSGPSIEPSSALVKAVMINAAMSIYGPLWDTAQGKRIAVLDPAPTMIQGWGLLTLAKTLVLRDSQDKLLVLTDTWNDDQDRGAKAWPALEQGEVAEFVLEGVSANHMHPLTVTLVWTDPPGVTGSSRCLVNDLDLEVEDSSGRLFKGNKGFNKNRSTAVDDSTPPDDLNPVEQVIVEDIEPGTVLVRVTARSVPGNGAESPFPSTRQGFALIARGLIGSGTAREKFENDAGEAHESEPGDAVLSADRHEVSEVEGTDATGVVDMDEEQEHAAGGELVGSCGCSTSGKGGPGPVPKAGLLVLPLLSIVLKRRLK